MATIRGSLVSGFVIVGPLLITLLGVVYLLRIIATLPIVTQIEPWFVRIPLVIVMFVVVVMATGYLMRTAIGTAVADFIVDVLNRIPLLRVVFNATHLAVDTALRGTGGRVEPVRLHAWKGLRVTAFTTGNKAPDGRVLCFLPTAPNITTGYVVEVTAEQIEPTGERIEDALTRLISAGFGDGNNGEQSGPDGRVVEYVRGVEVPDRE